MDSSDFNPEEFVRQYDNPNHIEGIYNYCDRWCERCTMTKHCRNYTTNMAIEQKVSKVTDNPDEQNKLFWEEMGKMMEDTMKLLEYTAKERGFDLHELKNSPESEKLFQEKNERRKSMMKSPLVLLARKYDDTCRKLIYKENSWLISKQDEWKKMMELGIDEESFLKEHYLIKDALEIINWYSPQMMVKLVRGLSADPESIIWSEENGFPKDSDGSAKVALIGMNRSMAAWSKIMNVFPDMQNIILDILVMLEKMKNGTIAAFPDAEKFKRPGFDD